MSGLADVMARAPRWHGRRVRAARSTLLFARNFLKNPRELGSMVPSSKFLIDKLLEPIHWAGVSIAIEYGPGTGGVTREILARLQGGARLIAFETNGEFVRHLRREIRDPRLHIVHTSAERVGAVLAGMGIARADAAVSSLPLSIMPAHVRLAILRETRAVLAPGAPLAGYQYSTRLIGEIRRAFGAVALGFEPRNWPPAFVFTARATD